MEIINNNLFFLLISFDPVLYALVLYQVLPIHIFLFFLIGIKPLSFSYYTDLFHPLDRVVVILLISENYIFIGLYLFLSGSRLLSRF